MTTRALLLCALLASAVATQSTVQFPFEVVSGSYASGGKTGAFGPSQIFQADWKAVAGSATELTLSLNVPPSFSGEVRLPAISLTTDGFAFCKALKSAGSTVGCKVVAGAVELEGLKMGASSATLIVRPVTKLGAVAPAPAAPAQAAAPVQPAPVAPAPTAPPAPTAEEDKELVDVKDSALADEERITKDEISKLEEQLTPEAKKNGRVRRLKRRLNKAMKEIRRLRTANANPPTCPNCPKPPAPVKTMSAAEYANRASQYIDVTPVNDLADEDQKLRDMGLNDKLAVDPKILHHGKWLNIAIAGEHKHFVKTHEKNCADPLCPLGADATAQPAIAIP